MVAQVLPNARHIAYHCNPMGAQMRRWPQAREHQQVRRGHCAPTQNDLIRCHDKAFSAAFHFNTSCSGAVKQDTSNQGITSNGQIEAVPNMRLVSYTEQAWDNHQDSIACAWS